MSEIKSAGERMTEFMATEDFKSLKSVEEVGGKNLHFLHGEITELRAAYEALQKENVELIKDRQHYANRADLSVGVLQAMNVAQAKRIEEHLELIEATAEFSKAFWENADKHSDTRVMVSTFQQLERKLRTYLPASKNGE